MSSSTYHLRISYAIITKAINFKYKIKSKIFFVPRYSSLVLCNPHPTPTTPGSQRSQNDANFNYGTRITRNYFRTTFINKLTKKFLNRLLYFVLANSMDVLNFLLVSTSL